MNVYEKFTVGRLKFVSRRGRSAKWSRDEMLKALRKERNSVNNPFVVVANGLQASADTPSRAKFIAKRFCVLFNAKNAVVLHKPTQIIMWEC